MRATIRPHAGVGPYRPGAMTSERARRRRCRRRSAPRSVDEWVRGGVAPRRRRARARAARRWRWPSPLATTLAVHVVHDERAAAFVALGLGLVTGRPALLLCTSGTAAANFHPAVVEAGLSDVPMLVLTADRPPELHGVGAPQTIDQTRLFGGVGAVVPRPGRRPTPPSSARGEPSPPARLAAATAEPARCTSTCRSANRCSDRSVRSRPAAVDGAPTTMRRPARPRTPTRPVAAPLGAARRHRRRRAQRRSPPTPSPSSPPDPGGRCSPTRRRGAARSAGAVAAFDVDRCATTAFAAAHRPDVVVRVGRPPASKVLSQWLVGSGAPVDAGRRHPARSTPTATSPVAVDALPDRSAWHRRSTTTGCGDWVDGRAPPPSRRIEQVLARAAGAHRAGASPARSQRRCRPMPSSWSPRRCRCATSSGTAAPPPGPHANRGANGIDGVMSTALGLALVADGPCVVLLGDIAFVHDAGALTAWRRRGVDLRDRGGRQRRRRHLLVPAAGRRHSTPTASSSCSARPTAPTSSPSPPPTASMRVDGDDGRRVATAVPRPRPSRTATSRVATDRAANVAVHAAVNDAVAAALRAADGGRSYGRTMARRASPGTWPASRRARPAGRCRRRCRRRRWRRATVRSSESWAQRIATAHVPLPAASTQPTAPP